MSDRRIEISADKIEGTDVVTSYETKATYLIAEVSHLNRRYTATVRIAERGVTNNGNFVSESFAMFAPTNLYERLEEAARFSRKRLEALASAPSVLATIEAMKTRCMEICHQEEARKREYAQVG